MNPQRSGTVSPPRLAPCLLPANEWAPGRCADDGRAAGQGHFVTLASSHFIRASLSLSASSVRWPSHELADHPCVTALGPRRGGRGIGLRCYPVRYPVNSVQPLDFAVGPLPGPLESVTRLARHAVEGEASHHNSRPSGLSANSPGPHPAAVASAMNPPSNWRPHTFSAALVALYMWEPKPLPVTESSRNSASYASSHVSHQPALSSNRFSGKSELHIPRRVSSAIVFLTVRREDSAWPGSRGHGLGCLLRRQVLGHALRSPPLFPRRPQSVREPACCSLGIRRPPNVRCAG